MAESIIEKCIELIGNRFKLSVLASQRTHDLNTGMNSSVVGTTKFKNRKNTIISLYEIAEKEVDRYELFKLLVKRCKEYMKGNIRTAYINNKDNLKNVLEISDKNFNLKSYTTINRESLGNVLNKN